MLRGVSGNALKNLTMHRKNHHKNDRTSMDPSLSGNGAQPYYWESGPHDVHKRKPAINGRRVKQPSCPKGLVDPSSISSPSLIIEQADKGRLDLLRCWTYVPFIVCLSLCVSWGPVAINDLLLSIKIFFLKHDHWTPGLYFSTFVVGPHESHAGLY